MLLLLSSHLSYQDGDDSRAGRGMRGTHTWTPVPESTEARDAAFYQAYAAVERAACAARMGRESVSGYPETVTPPIVALPMSANCNGSRAKLVVPSEMVPEAVAGCEVLWPALS